MIHRIFGPEATNPRTRRAYAHAVLARYKNGEASYNEAFEAAYKASQTRKGEAANLGKTLGGVVTKAYCRNFENDTVVISGLSPRGRVELAAKEAAGPPYSFSPDAYLVRPDANNVPSAAMIIQDPIAEGFRPLRAK